MADRGGEPGRRFPGVEYPPLQLRTFQQVTCYTVTVMPERFPDRHLWAIQVQLFTPGGWLVRHGHHLVAENGRLVPFMTGGGFPISDFFMPLQRALALAHRTAPTLQVDGVLAGDAYRQWMEADNG